MEVAPASVSKSEQRLLEALKAYPKGADSATLLSSLPGWTNEDILVNMNLLSSKRYVDFVSNSKTNSFVFMLRSQEDMSRVANMGGYEIIIYQLIKEAKQNGIWIKELKSRSGLHAKLVNSIIKDLEKKRIIKFVKPVNNPHKKMYLLSELEPSPALTGGMWYTDNEFDVDFIYQLSVQIFRYISYKTIPKERDSIYSHLSNSQTTAKDILEFITSNNITSAPLGLGDLETLLERLCLDGKIKKVLKYRNNSAIDSDTDEDEGDVYVYSTTTASYADAGKPYPFYGIPCVQASPPVSDRDPEFYNPINCSNFTKWLDDKIGFLETAHT